jgi:uncharacterized protein (UPF0264 family)
MPRPKLLISVRSCAEALAALDGGADLIDIKEPLRGPLGGADARTIAAIVAAVAGRKPVSAALGELIDPPSLALPHGLSYIKLGLHGAALRPWQKQLAQAFAKHPEAAPIAVAYVDEVRRGDPPTPTPHDVLQWAIDHRAAGILLDTHRKDAGHLLALRDVNWLRSFIDRAHTANLLVALAGSLGHELLGSALALKPDIVALRGAACAGGNRLLSIDAGRVRDLAAVIAAQSAPPHRPARPQATHAGD